MEIELGIQIALTLSGILSHFLKKVWERRDEGVTETLASYWTANPYRTAYTIIGAVAGFLFLYGTPELTRTTAWGIGFIANSVGESLGERARAKL